MALPHLAHQKRYKDFFQQRSRNDYIILDNGAAEEFEFGAKHLFTIADHLDVHEIVVPDALGDTEETLARALAFSRYAVPEYRYMAVAQGQTFQEVLKCMNAYLSMGPLNYITTIGLPRLLTYQDKRMRVTLAEWIMKEKFYATLEFHALGASAWMKEVMVLSDYPCIRGIDTSMPVDMGLQGLNIHKDEYIPRTPDFFELSKPNRQVEINSDIYLQWAGHDNQRIVEKAS